MNRKRMFLLATIAFNLIFLMTGSAFSQSNNPSTIEEVINAGNKSIIEGDWANAELKFREAVKLEPKQSLWHIQLLIALGQQKKWKDAFKEMKFVINNLDVTDWILSVNEKMPDGQVAFINTEIFGDEQHGILRYVKAVKGKKSVESIARDIGVKLDEFAKENMLALTYDISKFKNMPFESGNTIDVTNDFIAYYNARHKD